MTEMSEISQRDRVITTRQHTHGHASGGIAKWSQNNNKFGKWSQVLQEMGPKIAKIKTMKCYDTYEVSYDQDSIYSNNIGLN